MTRLLDSIIDTSLDARWRSPSLEYIGSESFFSPHSNPINIIAVSHAHLHSVGFTGEMWELLGECLVDVFGMYEIVQVRLYSKRLS